jgi:hypothetical protein
MNENSRIAMGMDNLEQRIAKEIAGIRVHGFDGNPLPSESQIDNSWMISDSTLREGYRRIANHLIALFREYTDTAGRGVMSEEIRSLLTELAGSASMCWENVLGAGVFDSAEAMRVSDDYLPRFLTLIAIVRVEVKDKCARELRDFIETACDWSDDLESWVVLKADLLKLADTWEGK